MEAKNNKRLIFVFWFLTAIVCHLPADLMAQDRTAKIRERILERDRSAVLVASHRGDWRNFPENSLEAIESAAEMGADIVEIDVRRTKDGCLILMHDERIDRTTTGKGLVSELTLDSIRQVNLRNGIAIKTGCKVPTLEEALLCAKGKVMLNLDKADDYFDQIYALLQKTGTTHQIIMKGSKSAEEVKKTFGRYLDEIIYMPIINLDDPDAEMKIRDFISLLNPPAFELLFKEKGNPLPEVLPDSLDGKALIWYNTLWDSQAGGYDDDLALKNPDEAYGYLVNRLGA